MKNIETEAVKENVGAGNSTYLSSIAVGEPFKLGDYEFVVLEHMEDTTAVVFKGLLHESERFGPNNNYNGSEVDKLCNDFGNEIESIVGSDNLIEHTVDLTSDDGLKDYKSVNRKMSLMTANDYRRYVEILDKHKVNAWWWTATAYSTPTHGFEYYVKCVSPSGYVYNNFGIYDYGGVRPFCILKSNILVSKLGGFKNE